MKLEKQIAESATQAGSALMTPLGPVQTTATGEVIIDRINVGKMPKGWEKLDVFTYFVHPGKIIRAWKDHITNFSVPLLLALVLVAGIPISIASLARILGYSQNANSTPVGPFELVLASMPTTFSMLGFAVAVVAAIAAQFLPKWKWLKAAVPVAAFATFFVVTWMHFSPLVSGAGLDEQKLNFGRIALQPRNPLTPQDALGDWGMTKGSQLPQIIKEEIASLNQGNELVKKYATTPITDLRGTWAYQSATAAKKDNDGNTIPATPAVEGGKPDTFRVAQVGNDTIFIFSIVLADTNDQSGWMGWSGVFHKEGDGWQFYNLDIRGVRGFKVAGYDTLTTAMPDVALALSKAFPQLLVKEQKVQEGDWK